MTTASSVAVFFGWFSPHMSTSQLCSWGPTAVHWLSDDCMSAWQGGFALHKWRLISIFRKFHTVWIQTRPAGWTFLCWFIQIISTSDSLYLTQSPVSVYRFLGSTGKWSFWCLYRELINCLKWYHLTQHWVGLKAKCLGMKKKQWMGSSEEIRLPDCYISHCLHKTSEITELLLTAWLLS